LIKTVFSLPKRRVEIDGLAKIGGRLYCMPEMALSKRGYVVVMRTHTASLGSFGKPR
jgi:hypothetical protein